MRCREPFCTEEEHKNGKPFRQEQKKSGMLLALLLAVMLLRLALTGETDPERLDELFLQY